MKRLILFSLLFVGLLSSAKAADGRMTDFTYLKSEGAMPAKLQQLLTSNEDEAQYIQSLVRSGRLIYGTEMNEYLEKIADNLLRKSPEVRQKLSFYLVKSASVNAMVAKQGVVLVNLGLLAQVTNESELAFILGHEIVHFTDHANRKRQKATSLSDYLNSHQNSREDELEADKLALERYFKNSDYSADALENVFDVFRYGELPFDELPFPKSEIETSFYKFPDNYYLANVKPIRSRTDYVDTLSTHPNLKKRQENLDRFIYNSSSNGSEFLQEKDKFLNIRDLARFECINFFLTWHDYGDAISNIFVLKNQFPNNNFLKIAEAAAYYGFHKHRTYGDVKDVVEPFKEIEGEKQQICYFLNKINKKEANVLAIRKLVSASKEVPQNDFLKKMATDALYDLLKENNMELTDFSDYPEGTVAADSTVVVGNTENQPEKSQEKTDKYSRIREKKEKKQLVLPSEKFKTVNYMLVDLKNDALFSSLYEEALSKIEDEEALAIAGIEKPIIGANDKVLVWQPTYSKFNKKTRKTTTPSLGNSQLRSTINQTVKSLKIDADIYTSKMPKTLTTEEFNRMALVGQWRIEYRQIGFDRMQLYQQQYLQSELGSSYRYISLINEGSESAKFMKGYKWSILYRAPVCVATIPFDLLIFAIPNRDKALYVNLYDIESGKTVFGKHYNIEGIDANAYINKTLYDYFYYLKKGIKIK